MSTIDEPPVLYANVACDPAIWLEVPAAWGPETWSGPVEWAAAMARACWADLTPGPTSVARTEALLTEYATTYGGEDPITPFEVLIYLHFPDPGDFPVLVRVWIDDTPGLSVEESSGANLSTAIEPPIVEEFITDKLGKGLRVLQYHAFTPRSPDGTTDGDALYAAVQYAFAIPGHEAVLTVVAIDPHRGRLTASMDDLDEFVRGIQWDDEPLDLVSSVRTEAPAGMSDRRAQVVVPRPKLTVLAILDETWGFAADSRGRRIGARARLAVVISLFATLLSFLAVIGFGHEPPIRLWAAPAVLAFTARIVCRAPDRRLPVLGYLIGLTAGVCLFFGLIGIAVGDPLLTTTVPLCLASIVLSILWRPRAPRPEGAVG